MLNIYFHHHHNKSNPFIIILIVWSNSIDLLLMMMMMIWLRFFFQSIQPMTTIQHYVINWMNERTLFTQVFSMWMTVPKIDKSVNRSIIEPTFHGQSSSYWIKNNKINRKKRTSIDVMSIWWMYVLNIYLIKYKFEWSFIFKE